MGPAHNDDLSRLARVLALPLDAQRRERVAEEQLRMVLSHTRAGTLVATAFAVVMAMHLAPGLPAMLVWGWLAAKVGVAALRMGLAWGRQRVVQAQHKALWRRVIYSSLAADGLVWGAAGWWLMGQNESVASLVAAVLAGVSSVATFGLQVRLAATAAYAAPILVPAALALMLRGDDFGWVGGIGLLLLLGLQLLTARGAQRRLAATVLLQLNAQALASEREAALNLAQHQSVVKSQFVAKVSHELRTPLHGMLGLTRLLQAHSTEADTRRRADLIEVSGLHLLALINDLLDVSRIESGNFAMRREPFDLADEVDLVTQMFASRASDKGLALQLQLHAPNPCWVHGDAARLRQVLHNLLGNAVKFTHQGSVRLVVHGPDAAGMVQVEVEDTGVGVPTQDQAAIFQPFRQSHVGEGSPPEGAGLGLTIAREIAQGMGGDVQVRSAPGQGSCFMFTAHLPPTEAVPAPSAVAPPVAPAPRAPLPESAALPRRVLVAEDDEVNAMIVMAFLDHLGVQAERVANGRQAVARALREGQRPDLVLMDCRMPELDGPNATREIRREEQARGWPRLAVVALTATSAESDREHCLAAGMDDFVPKPFSREDLRLALARNWHPQAVAAAAAAARV